MVQPKAPMKPEIRSVPRATGGAVPYAMQEHLARSKSRYTCIPVIAWTGPLGVVP